MSNKQPSLSEVMGKRAEAAEAIVDFLKGKTVQECIDTLDAVKRRILADTVVA